MKQSKEESKTFDESIVERRKETIKKLISDMDKLTSEVEDKISSCTTVSEIESIYDSIKATVPKQDDEMCDTIDLINSIMGIEPMTDAEKSEALEDAKKRNEQLHTLIEEQARWTEFLKPYIDAAIELAQEDYERKPITEESYETIKEKVRKRISNTCENNNK